MIEVSNLKYQIADTNNSLLSIPNLKVIDSEKILIQGPSGCGKTTFLHLLAGLLPVDSGEIKFNNFIFNHSQVSIQKWRRENLSMVLQRLSLWPELTVIENLLIENNDPLSAKNIISDVDLSSLMNTKCEKLSLGEQQRVAIARAVIKPFKYLFADEPTSSLDDVNCERIMKTLEKYCSEKNLICVSHDHRITKFFDRVIDFNNLNRGQK